MAKLRVAGLVLGLGCVSVALGSVTPALIGAAHAAPAPGPLPAFPTTTTSTTTTTTTTTVPGDNGTTTTTLPGTTTTSVPPSGDYLTGVIPPDAAAEIAAFHPTPPGSTEPLIAALAPLSEFGITPAEAAVVGFGRFPVAGRAVWSDDYLSPRFQADGSFRFHHATDIPAACGTPLRAPDDGVLTEGSDPGGGTTVEITEDDGTYLFLAHLSAYAVGIQSGDRVHIGDVIGYVGETGAATGCHLHLEIHPRGGLPVDPKPFLDAWYQDALTDAPLLVDEARADHGLPSLHLPVPDPGLFLP